MIKVNKKIISNILISILLFVILLLLTSMPVFALNIIGSGSGGSGSTSTDDSSSSFAIQKTGYVAGYRFSYTDFYGTAYGTVDIIDYNNNSWYEYSADAYARKTTSKKYNKRDLVKLYNSGESFSFSMVRTSSSTAYKDDGTYKLKYSVDSMSTNMKNWKTDENVNRILKLMNSSYSVSNMKANDKILVEPIVLCEFKGNHYALTLTEIWTLAGSEYGYSTKAAYGTKNKNTYNWIAYRLNGTFPNNFYVGEDTSICNKATQLSVPSRGDGTIGPAFSTLITKGYGLHILFKDDTTIPVASVYVKKNDAVWNNDDLVIKIVNSSKTYTLKAGAGNVYQLNNVPVGTYNVYATPKSDTEPVDSGVDIVIKGDGGVATVNYYTLTTSGDTGIKSTSPTSKTFLKGQTATMSATLNNGYRWSKWDKIKGDSEDADLPEQTDTIKMDSQKEYKAISIETYLTVNYYSNYANKSFPDPPNAIGPDKNVIVRTHKFYYSKEYPGGLHNYVSTESETYLGRTGYKANGYWNTVTDGSGISVHMNDSFASGQALAEVFGKSIKTSNATVNVYAQWSPYKLTVNYYSNYADKSFENPLNEVGADKNVIVRSHKFSYGKSLPDGLHNYVSTASATYLGRTYYKGTGYWNTAADGSGIGIHMNTGFDTIQALAKAFGKNIDNGNASVDVYAQWNPYTFSVNYYSNYADKAFDATLNSVGPDKSVLVKTSVFKITTNTVNGLINYVNETDVYYMSRTYYQATGYWNTEADGSGIEVHQSTSFENSQKVAEAFGKSIESSNASVDVYAQWDPYKLTVNYYSNYADKSFSEALNAVSEDKNVLVRTFDYYCNHPANDCNLHNYTSENASTYLGRTNYAATGYWNTEIDGSGKEIHQDTSFNSTQDIAIALGKDIRTSNQVVNVYAQWISASCEYIVRHWLFDPNVSEYILHEQKTPNPTAKMDETVVEYFKKYYGYKPEYAKYVDKNHSEETTSYDTKSCSIVVNENSYINFHYMPEKSLTLIYDLNGGLYNNSPDDVIFKDLPFYSTITLLDKPINDNSIFTGWYKGIGAENSYSGYMGYNPNKFIITKNTILYATWNTNSSKEIDIVANQIYGDIVAGSQITVSATVINNTNKNIIPDDNVKVILDVIKSDNTIMCTKEITGVVIPAYNKNLVYFNIDIPEEINENERLEFKWSILE